MTFNFRTLDRRLKPLLRKLEKMCEECGLEMYQLLGILGRKYYFNNKSGKIRDQKRGRFFDEVFKGITYINKPVPLDICLFIMVSLEIGDRKYSGILI